VSDAARRTVLYATDFSEASTPAFAQALRIAREKGALLLVAHAYQERSLPALGYAAVPAFEDWDRQLRALAEKELEWLLARARAEGVNAEPLLLEGFPDEAIVEAARARRVDLIVVGTHGRRGAARVFLGSVAARVTATAPCPVLTVGPGAAPR
jgi:nucleotide-binding universal stress UspA family protein